MKKRRGSKMIKQDKRIALYIPLDMFNLGVAVFRSETKRLAVLQKQGCVDLERQNDSALASAHMDYTSDGAIRLSMVIKPGATRSTWAHECSHIADFAMEYLGIPPGVESTEVRAYLVGHLFWHLDNSEVPL